MKKYTCVIIVFMMMSWGCYRSKSSYNSTFSLFSKETTCNCKLYVEVYNVGILNNLTANYLTDSINFKIYAGTFDDENGYIYYTCLGDNISIEKRERTNQVFKVDSSIVNGKLVIAPNLKYLLKTTNKITYSLKDLKKQNKFE